MTANPNALPPGIQAKLYDMLLAAHKGDAKLSWLHGLVQRAGYVRYDGGQDSVLVTAKQLEKLLDRAPRTIRALIRDGMPCARQGVGAMPSLFDARAVFSWLKIKDGGDPLLNGDGKSKALEEYRREKAREAKRNNEVAEGLLVETATVGQAMKEIFAVFRDRAKVIEDLHGPEVGAAIREMVEDACGRSDAKMPEGVKV